MTATKEQKQRTMRDLSRIAGEDCIDVLFFHDGFAAYFPSELGALRVANVYGPTAERVRQNPNGSWRVATKKRI